MALTAAVLRRWPLPSLDGASSKEDRGRVLVVGGSDELAGSLLLAAEAALRAGAGKLQAATVKRVSGTLAVHIPEARVLALPARGGAIAGHTPALLKAAHDADAVLVGCGMEPGASTRRLVAALLRVARCPVVLDAGALVSGRRARAGASPLLLTPHLGEMSSLTGQHKDYIADNQVDVARAFARDNAVALALKGAVSVVCDAQGACWEYRRGPIGLGTSGSGDVLAGIVAGLLARGAAPVQALAWGIWVHGEAGRRLGQRVGHVGYLARELLREIPPIIDRLSNAKRS